MSYKTKLTTYKINYEIFNKLNIELENQKKKISIFDFKFNEIATFFLELDT